MLFSSPDYPIFLIAVFFLYALARWGGAPFAWARLAVMIVLADVVVLLVSKDLDTLWDPIGGVVLRLAASGEPDWPSSLAWRWPIGLVVVIGAIQLGRRRAAWIASDAGQRILARAVVGVLAAVGATVAIAMANDALDEVTAAIVAYAHLVILFVLGVGLGLSRTDDHRPLGRVVLLFVASSLFYHAWAAAMPGPYRYLLALLLGTIALDYYLALWIEATEDPWTRKLLVVVSLCSNLGILVVFKYTDFFTQDVLHLPVRPLHLILPAGISFHTFQSLSYTIDVYRRQLRATRSVITFATFVLFFPQLVAGPIVRAQDLLPQLEAPPALDLAKATAGLYRIVIGLFKKIALADTLALGIVDRVFENPERFSAVEVAAGVYGYALQIYLDFSAYSDIAIGSAQVIGFDLPENFRTPYRSANLQEFWRRWHISLSTWLRDYLYISLGGSKGAPWRTYVNLILTMLLGGLWHGASWAFIVWGALHGFGLAVTRYFQRAPHEDSLRLAAICGGLSIAGVAVLRTAFADAGAWTGLVVLWLAWTPLWAVLTAWLSRDDRDTAEPPAPLPSEGLPWRALWRPVAELGPAGGSTIGPLWLPEVLRILMCKAGVWFLIALAWWPSETWIPLVALTWALGLAADVCEADRGDPWPRIVALARRTAAVVLVFHYVCLAWIFFRASSFDNALAILRQLAGGETDHANLVPLVTTALAVGFAAHFFAAGSYRWLRMRFVALPTPLQGLVLAAVVFVLRELGHTKIVPFIYFQF